MLENLNHWKTSIIGAIIAILSILRTFHLVTAEQLQSLTDAIPVVGDKAVEIIAIVIGWFLMFKAKDAKAVKSKKVL